MKWHILILLIVFMPLVTAQNFDAELTDEDRDAFDTILSPLMKIYQFIKYAATLIAVMVMLVAGVKFMMNGDDMAKRNEAKNMATYVILGLAVIWAAPFIVELFV